MRSFSLGRRAILVAMLGLSLAGCASFGSGGLVASSAPPDLSGPAAPAIAGDLVTKFAEQVGPGSGTIVLKRDGSPFGQALETSLKSWGYAVATDQKTDDKKTIPLVYAIESYNGQILARLLTAHVELGRAYAATAAGDRRRVRSPLCGAGRGGRLWRTTVQGDVDAGLRR